MLKKAAKIEIGDKYLSCYETCRNLLTNESMLHFPDFRKLFTLTIG